MAKMWAVVDDSHDLIMARTCESKKDAEDLAAQWSLANHLSEYVVYEAIETVKATIPSTITAVTE